jgi:XTP/dITP diphosphohydrolase
MIQVLFASRNGHKLQEIRQMLGDICRVWGLGELLNPPILREDADSFAGNAEGKARQVADWLLADPDRLAVWGASLPLVVLADDSGLEVDALDGAPGVHSARFAHLGGWQVGNASDAANNERLLGMLEGVSAARRGARFRCVLAALEVRRGEAMVMGERGGLEVGFVRYYEGVCEGMIGRGPRGGAGFGYDPLFIPEGREETFAELGEGVKNRLSHRHRALERFKADLGWGGMRSGLR